MTAISDPKKISEIREDLDSFIVKNSQNPFMLSVFIEKEMESALRKGQDPIVLVTMADGKIVSVAPLLIKRKLGLGFASWLFSHWFSPDFILDKDHRETCMESALDFVFDHLQCQFGTIDLPSESSNLQTLCKIGESNGFQYSKTTDDWLNHRVMRVDCKWDDYQKSKGRSFRRRFRQIEQQLSSSGNWEIRVFEDEDGEEEALRKIMAVEDASWKQSWRTQNGASVDEELLTVWEASSTALKTFSGLRRSVWFLELNGQAIAYTMVLQYKGVAYTFKTSFDDKYRKLSPGIYIKNVALRDLFNSGRVALIDFMTNLPFHDRWTSTQQSRVEFLLSKGFLPNLIRRTIQQPQARTVMRRLLPKSLSGL